MRANVDGDGILSWETSLALDSSDYPHISYYGYFPLGDEWRRELRYARWDGNDWDDIQTVDRSANFVGQYNSLALDSLGRPRIAYCDWTARDLKYAKWISGTTWQIETVDSTDVVGRRCALALESSGDAHIVYEDLTNHRLKYAEWTGSAWSFSKTIETYGVQPSLVLDASDYPHIAYTDYDTKNLPYVVWNGTDWDPTETVDDSGPDAYPCLALGPGNLPAIAYCVGWVGTSDVKYAEWNPTTETWDIETVDAGRAGKIEVWLALTAAGQPQITFTDGRIFPVDYTDLLYASATGPLAVRWPR